jgi:hypothetical protein
MLIDVHALSGKKLWSELLKNKLKTRKYKKWYEKTWKVH